MIPAFPIGATPPPGRQASREAATALAPCLLDRVFPPCQCVDAIATEWMTTGATTAIARHLIERSTP